MIKMMWISLFYYSEDNSGMGSTAAIDPIDYGNFIISNGKGSWLHGITI